MPSPNLEVFYVESGSLVVTFDAPVTITRLGDVESGGEMVPAGTEFVIESGEFGVLQPGTGSEIRNEGSEPAAVSIAGLVPAGAGGATVASPEATPAG
jgi:mannose-6-phosphate isomerase-like protein (cupin superfamily)